MAINVQNIFGVIGAIGGILGIISWIKTHKNGNRQFNQITYNNHIKHKYKICFENDKCLETDKVNIYYLSCLIKNIKEFKKVDNKFKGFNTKLAFNDAFLYAAVIVLRNFTGFNWFVNDIEFNNEKTIDYYEKNKIHIQRLKPFLKEFYILVFESLH